MNLRTLKTFAYETLCIKWMKPPQYHATMKKMVTNGRKVN
jgi:hypothetical protein